MTPIGRNADPAARSRRGAPRARPAAAPRAAIGCRRTGEARAALPIGCRRQQATGRADNKEVTCGAAGAGLRCVRAAGTGCGGLGWKRGASERRHLGAGSASASLVCLVYHLVVLIVPLLKV